jgi:hypothetical protein
MSQTIQEILALANEAAELASTNMAETSTGGERRLLPAGAYLGRFVEYLELGKHPGEYQGKPTAPAPLCRIGFALYGPDAQDAEGKPYILRSFDMKLGNNSKGKTKLAFDRMNYKGTATHFAQLLGEGYVVFVKLVKSKTTGKERNEISFAEIAPPVEALSKQPYAVPVPADDLYRIFLWDVPRKSDWDALFIDGTNEDQTSRNYLQNACFAAENFHGSALESMLKSNGVAIELPPAEAEVPTAPASIAAPAALTAEIPQVAAPAVATPTAPAVAAPVVAPTAPVAPAVPAVAPAVAPAVVTAVAPVLAPAVPVVPTVPVVA